MYVFPVDCYVTIYDVYIMAEQVVTFFLLAKNSSSIQHCIRINHMHYSTY